MRQQKGFSLLEAIVAMVILTTVGLAVFSWLNNYFNYLAAVERIARETVLIRNVSEMMQTINPLLQPEGTVDWESDDADEVRWTSSFIMAPRDGVRNTGMIGFYQVSLHQVDVEILSAKHETIRFDLRLVGYQQARRPSFEDF